ncbi:MAG: Zn-dependent hydrolase, glyoxylase, partial [Akkermansiaceae bacterium]|nr:Zn-dependent hydrolase, glyoxylase [Akkermansiaceae bacterium]
MSAVPKVEEVVAGVYLVPLGPVNVFLLRGEEEWVLIDAGLPGSAAKILAAAESLGIRRKEISTLILTHAHPDHIGAAAAIQKVTGAQVMVHALDAGIVTAGTGFRPMKTAPGVMNRLVVRPLIRLMASRMKRVEPVRV